jgi:hypothetical protein
MDKVMMALNNIGLRGRCILEFCCTQMANYAMPSLCRTMNRQGFGMMTSRFERQQHSQLATSMSQISVSTILGTKPS